MPSRYRDAVTGEYVTAEEAKKRPRETVKETDKKRPSTSLSPLEPALTPENDEDLKATVRERLATPKRVRSTIDDL